MLEPTVDLELLRHFFGWCAVINLAFLLWWFAFLVFAQNWVYRIHCKFTAISKEQFLAIHYAGMGLFKLMILLFCVTPYLALWILR
jgi:hypothetical protein